MNISNRILAKNILVSNDMFKTKLNNNDMIIGASGAGKSSGYVIPNIMKCSESMIVADTKGILHRQLRKGLEESGFKVYVLDFVNLEQSCSYNPLDYIEYDKKSGTYREKDIITIAQAMIPSHRNGDPFWDEAARVVLECMIAFVMETQPQSERNFVSVTELYKVLADGIGFRLFEELEAENPNSFAVRRYNSFKNVFAVEKTWGCISQFLTNALDLYDFSETRRLFSGTERFSFCNLGRRKTVLFVNVSDTDRAFDRLVNVFYTQAFQQLMREADRHGDGRLKVPVRIILDDFANNVYIPDFDKIISVIRSRELSVSVILQSISQLETLYTPAQAVTILNGCDHMLYLGGQDVKTAGYISRKANLPMETILNMGLDDAYLFERGSFPQKAEKLNLYGEEITDVIGKNTNQSFDSKCREGRYQPGCIHSGSHRKDYECTHS